MRAPTAIWLLCCTKQCSWVLPCPLTQWTPSICSGICVLGSQSTINTYGRNPRCLTRRSPHKSTLVWPILGRVFPSGTPSSDRLHYTGKAWTANLIAGRSSQTTSPDLLSGPCPLRAKESSICGDGMHLEATLQNESCHQPRSPMAREISAESFERRLFIATLSPL